MRPAGSKLAPLLPSSFLISQPWSCWCAVLERAGEAIAKQVGMSGVLFGATVLAASTWLPKLSTGLASMSLQDYQLALSDIFGGNAFLPVLFLLASLLSGEAVLPQAQKADIYLTGLGMFLTLVYITRLIFRPQKQIFTWVSIR